MDERTIPEGEFDCVIVGAGTAGYVLVNRLGEVRDVSVLIIEAGGKDDYHWIRRLESRLLLDLASVIAHRDRVPQGGKAEKSAPGTVRLFGRRTSEGGGIEDWTYYVAMRAHEARSQAAMAWVRASRLCCAFRL